GLRIPFIGAAVLNLVNFVYGLFVLPESLAVEHRRPFSFRRANPFAALKNLTRHPIVLGLTGTLVCAYLAQQILQTVWALYGQVRYAWTPFEIGISLAIVGITSAAVQMGLLRVILPRLGERKALVLGTIVSAFGFAAFGFATRGWMMYLLIL